MGFLADYRGNQNEKGTILRYPPRDADQSLLCRHEAVVSVDRFGEDVTMPEFGPRMVCTSCGVIGAAVRPNWQERPPPESITGSQWR